MRHSTFRDRGSPSVAEIRIGLVDEPPGIDLNANINVKRLDTPPKVNQSGYQNLHNVTAT